MEINLHGVTSIEWKETQESGFNRGYGWRILTVTYGNGQQTDIVLFGQIENLNNVKESKE